VDVASPGLSPTDLATRLRAAGLRVTQPRLAVYRALSQLGGHRSVDEVVARLAGSGDPPVRMSVYNAIEALSGAGLVMAADTGSGRALYEVASTWHHHFVCRVCGRVIDVPCATGAKPCLTPNTAVGEVDEAQVIYRGRCPGCLAA
jgi:Fur family ferric uptake transcriptional regulator